MHSPHSSLPVGGHPDHPPPPRQDRAFAIGIGLNLSFVPLEAYHGWKANSLALLADAGHNLGDVAGLVLAWLGMIASRRRPNARHTYGWKRAGLLAAFANALLLLPGIAYLAWEAVGRLGESSAPVPGGTLMVVAGIGIVINTATALLFLRGRARDINVRGAFLHMAADALVSAGVVAAGALVLAFGWAWLDPVLSLVIAAVILTATWGLLRQSAHLLFDGVPDTIRLEEVRGYLAGLPGVTSVHDLHIWALGATEIALTAHLEWPEGGPDDTFHQRTAAELHRRFGIGHVTLQVVRKPFCQPWDGPPRPAG